MVLNLQTETYGVKVYVTANTLIYDVEVEQFLNYIDFLHKINVDAVIMQDIGMIDLVRHIYPNLEIHASTQLHIHNLEGVKLCEELGIKRAVLARETPIELVRDIKNNTNIELEIFVHGALCMSYSGQCLISSLIGGRSGNRGECTGTCRMPFSLEYKDEVIRENEYLLSTKELNTSGMIERLKKSSIYSFKIEGRMKSPLYVGFVTRLYRRLLDGENIDLESFTNQLKTIFNRDFTKGRLFLEGDKEIMNTKSPNHIGLRIGKAFLAGDKIGIKLDKMSVLNQNDAIRFLNSGKGMMINYLYDSKLKFTNKATDICYVSNKVDLKEEDIVCKTQDYLLKREYENVLEKKIPISFKVVAKKGQFLRVTISDGDVDFSLEEDAVLDAISAPITQESIIKQLGKLGDSPFSLDSCQVILDDGVFIQIKILNEMRRKLVQELVNSRMNKKKDVVLRDVKFPVAKDACFNNEVLISCLVRNEEQLRACLAMDVFRVYVPDKKLYEKYKKDERVWKFIDRCSFNISEKLEERSYVSDYLFVGDKNVLGSYSLNVTNTYTAYYLTKLGFREIPLSVEVSEEEAKLLIDRYQKKFSYRYFEILGYGLVENMIIKGNILDINENVYEYNLVDFKNRKFPIYFDGVNTHILNCEIRQVRSVPKNVIIRLDFYLESEEEIRNVVKMYKDT